MRHHLGSALNWPFMVFDISLLSFFFFSLISTSTRRSSHCWSSVNLSGFFYLSLRLWVCLFHLYSTQLLSLHPPSWIFVSSHLCYSASAISISTQPHPTAICQGHRLHFAICCKIKLGEVVYLSLFGLPLPSAIFPFASGLTRQERERDGGRWPGWQPKLRWAFVLCVGLVVRLVGISMCHFFFFFFLVHHISAALAQIQTHTSALPYSYPILFPIWVLGQFIQ